MIPPARRRRRRRRRPGRRRPPAAWPTGNGPHSRHSRDFRRSQLLLLSEAARVRAGISSTSAVGRNHMSFAYSHSLSWRLALRQEAETGLPGVSSQESFVSDVVFSGNLYQCLFRYWRHRPPTSTVSRHRGPISVTGKLADLTLVVEIETDKPRVDRRSHRSSGTTRQHSIHFGYFLSL